MKKRRVIFTVVVMLLIIACFIFAKAFNDLKKEKQIKNEIEEIVQVFGTENVDDDDVNAILDRRLYKKGNYAKLEDAVKNYYKDLYDDIKNITFLMDDDNFTNYLTVENIKEDGPEFLKSKSNLQTTKSQINDKYQEFEKQLNQDTMKIIYIYEKKVDDYYQNLYMEFLNEYIPSNLSEDIKTKYDNSLKKIDLYVEAFDFLSTNKDHWKITADVLTFDDTALFEEYNSILDKINELTKDLQQTS